jgi:hypothetical protein
MDDNTAGETCDDECGCDFVHHTVIDGRPVQIHHVIPDDGAPHSDTSECGCGPDVRRVSDDLMVFDHVDQDAPDEPDE